MPHRAQLITYFFVILPNGFPDLMLLVAIAFVLLIKSMLQGQLESESSCLAFLRVVTVFVPAVISALMQILVFELTLSIVSFLRFSVKSYLLPSNFSYLIWN